MPLLVPVLALAIFAQGTSEFMLAGLLLPSPSISMSIRRRRPC